MNGNWKVAALLLDFGAKINQRSEIGWTPLMRAAWTGHYDYVRVLLQRVRVYVSAAVPSVAVA